MFTLNPLPAVFIVLAFQGPSGASSADAPECKAFSELYTSGKELCENMWDGAFKYETDETSAYTMWFFDATNPNDAVAKKVGKLTTSDHEQCHLRYYHKDKPGPEPDQFTECHPWKENACCNHFTVMTSQKLKEGYGKEYHWDRCGPLSPECERFFVQESCFYECDPNAGLYRKFHPSVFNKSNKDHNEWQMSNMPIRASYCNAWYTACRHDKFCASGGGSYFSCAAEYKKVDESKAAELKLAQEKAQLQRDLKAAEEKAQAAEANRGSTKSDDDLGTGPIVGFIVAGVLVLALLTCSCFLIIKERAGKPVFARKLLDSQGPTGGGQAVGNSQF